MVSSCIVPGCTATTARKGSGISYYRLPTKDDERWRLWLKAAKNPKYRENSSKESVKNLRVCSLHFKPEDFQRSFFVGSEIRVKKLKETAIPSTNLDEEEPGPSTASPDVNDHSKDMGQSLGQFTSIGIQVNLPRTMDKSSQHYIVDEEAIMQLMQNCPKCKRKCSCRKRIHGICVVFYQGCYFCDYQRKWASQPEDGTITNYETHKPKKKQPKDKDSSKAKTPPSQTEETLVPQPSVSESHNLLETKETLPTPS